MILMVVIPALAVIVMDFLRLKRNRLRRELFISLIFYFISGVYVILHMLQVPIPSPLSAIRYVFLPLDQYLNEWLS